MVGSSIFVIFAVSDVLLADAYKLQNLRFIRKLTASDTSKTAKITKLFLYI